MYCQKCRTPLKLHSSLESLNPASFHLLADQPAAADAPPTSQSHAAAATSSKQQKQRYAEASSHARSPVFSRNATKHSTDRDTAPAPASGPPSPTAGRGAMSFINITDSQVVAPAIAHKANSQERRSSRSQSQRRRSSSRQDSIGEEDGRLSRKMQTSTNLFDILSSRSDIDHPVCVECTDTLVEQMEKRLTSTAKERDAYVDFLRNMHADAPTPDEAAATQAELTATRQREAAALSELEELEQAKASLEREVAALEDEAAALDASEAAFWDERNAFTRTLAAFHAERDSINLRYDHDARLLQRLQRTDVYTDAFHISYDGSFGTINGLRLGRLARPEVEWSEVNAAWGMALLLLDTLATKLAFTFRGYRLHALGSASAIEKLPDSDSVGASSPTATRASLASDDSASSSAKPGALLPLHRSDTPLNLTWMHKGFDAAMVAFLACMAQLGRHVEVTTAARRRDAPASRSADGSAQAQQVKMPYEIARDRIHDCSIKSMGFVNDENWTRACKHTLTYCKFLMAYTRDVKVGGREA